MVEAVLKYKPKPRPTNFYVFERITSGLYFCAGYADTILQNQPQHTNHDCVWVIFVCWLYSFAGCMLKSMVKGLLVYHCYD